MKLSKRGVKAQNGREAPPHALWLQFTNRTPAASGWFTLYLRYVYEKEHHALLLNQIAWYWFYDIVGPDFLFRDFL